MPFISMRMDEGMKVGVTVRTQQSREIEFEQTSQSVLILKRDALFTIAHGRPHACIRLTWKLT